MGKQLVNHTRADSSVVNQDGQQITFTVPRQFDVERYSLIFRGAFNVTTVGAGLTTNQLWGYIRRIELIASGQTVIRSFTGFECAAIEAYFQKYDIVNSIACRSNPNNVVGSQAFSMMLPLSLALPDMVRPKDSNLRAEALASLELRITFGNITDVLGAGAVGTINANMLVQVANVLELANDDEKRSAPMYITKITQIDVSTAAANANFLQRLPVGNTLRAIFLTPKQNGLPYSPTVAQPALNTFIVQRGTDNRINLTMVEMLYNYAKEAKLAPAQLPFVGVYDFMLRGQGSGQGKITEGFRVDGAMDLNGLFDFPALANGVLTMTIVEYIEMRRTK